MMKKDEIIKSIEKQFEDAPDFISIKFLAQKMGLSISFITRRVKNGEIKAIRDGKIIRIPKLCAIDYIANSIE